MTTTSLYEILKIKESCTSDEVTNAWKEKQKTLPPNGEPYQKAFKAYETLIDPVKREMYNTFRIGGLDISKYDNPLSFSSQLMEMKPVKEYERLMAKRYEVVVNHKYVNVTLDDLYNGKTVKVNVHFREPCKQCMNFVTVVTCPSCRGIPIPCATCSGARTVRQFKTCTFCNGMKFILEDVAVEVVIKRGMRDNQKIRMTVINPISHILSGVTFTLKQKQHEDFKRHDNDLYIIKKIGITEALCGCNIIIKHLDGRQLVATTAPGMVLLSGCVRVIEGEGMPAEVIKERGRGNLIIQFQVKFPSKLMIDKDSLKDLESFLPKRPQFIMPSHPETEEFEFTNFDPSFKMTPSHRNDDAYLDEKYDKKHEIKSKEQCLHQ